MIQLENNIPLPQDTAYHGARKYPFPMMEIGQSFFVEPMKRSSVSTSASLYSKSHPQKFTIMKWEGEINGEWKKGYRCWRIA